MKSFFSTVNYLIKLECEKYRIPYHLAVGMLLFPMLIVLLFGLGIIFPQTRATALYMVEENHPVEILTFVFLLTGSLMGLHLAWWVKSRKQQDIIWIFFTLFSFGLFLVAMEEIAWGQQFLGFDTPDAIKSVNKQGELTLHNLKGLQGHSEFFRIIFGIGGLIGLWQSSYVSLHKIGVPLLLLTWFLTITAVAGVDLYNDFFPIESRFDHGMQRMSEVIEMLIGVAGFFYIYLMTRKLKHKRT